MRQSTGKVKTGQLWSKNKADLAKQLGELKTELGQLRTQKIAGGSASKLTKMCVYPFGCCVD
jgi:large subunit ribosomal protein L35e